MTGRYHVGVDIGGTFTDVVRLDETSGDVAIFKVLSTPADLAEGFLDGVDRSGSGDGVVRLVHATTVATNAIIEGRTARTALLTTRGFRDILEIGRQIRPDLYDLFRDKPRPLIPRERCYEIDERVGPGGQVIRPLLEADVAAVADRLRGDGVEAVVICFLHSYVNPAHERQALEILRRAGVDAFVTLSSDVCPEFREFYRASTAVVNAAVQPLVVRYLDSVEAGLQERGIDAPLNVMQSSGGTIHAADARAQPVRIVESGPAAGVLAAAHIAATVGRLNVISFDMGGTTAKTGLIQQGKPRLSTDYEVGGMAVTGRGGQGRGSGYPIRTPVVDLVEIGAGGGSIAWVDRGGALRVGPRSAGAAPGPACYGQGGAGPTVTDANLVLGRLDPDYFLGGAMTLDVAAAERAIAEHCARPLGLSVVAAAAGIVAIADAAMTGAIRLVTVQRGYDPRDFALVAFGGAGPLHAGALAAELSIPLVVVPPGPGVTSALGLLLADVRRDYVLTRIQPLARLDLDWLVAQYADWDARGWAELRAEGLAPESITFERQVDLRYVGQSYELSLPLSAGRLDASASSELAARFHQEHERAYGFAAPEEPVELVHLKLTAIGRVARPQRPELAEQRDPIAAVVGKRPVYAESGFTVSPVYDRYRLGRGARVEGPAIIAEMDSTTFVHPRHAATVDRYGNLLIAAAGS